MEYLLLNKTETPTIDNNTSQKIDALTNIRSFDVMLMTILLPPRALKATNLISVIGLLLLQMLDIM